MKPSTPWRLVVLAHVVVGVLALAIPDAVRLALAKEGPVEQLSHVVLLVAMVAWARRATVLRGAGMAWVAWLVAGYVGFVLLEEVDWGAVYGVSGLSPWSSANLHNASGGHAYGLLAFPLVAVFLVPLLVEREPLPSRAHAFAVIAVVALSLLGSVLAPGWEAELDELSETVFYGVVVASGASGLSRST